MKFCCDENAKEIGDNVDNDNNVDVVNEYNVYVYWNVVSLSTMPNENNNKLLSQCLLELEDKT
jgi:hypothetical protein